MKNTDSFVAALEDLAVVEISGADAAHFLNSQLTQDVASLAPGRACLAGYCTAKGRLLASMVVWPDSQSGSPRLRALVKADLAHALVKRLSMFVLRAKAKLTVESAPVIGVSVVDGAGPALGGSDDESAVLSQAVKGLDPNAATYDTVFNEAGTWIAAPCATVKQKRWWFVPASASADHQARSDLLGDWQAADIAAGLPWVEAATQDLFIPQTLNLDLIDGVSFTKGCYPGQEVVARSHYRGTIKRRMARGMIALPVQTATAEASSETAAASSTATAPGADSAKIAQPGVDIFDARSPDSPCGRIINAARCSEATAEHVLMEVQLADLESADFRLDGPDGMPIQLQSLPYEIKSAA
ncbi:MAG TPA: folate-binding protein [Burkholderiaceae bacterium]|nr:folate-binding protein [Burkholderiaceae bacterium]